MVASSHEMAMLSILNSMLTGIKDSLLGHKLRTQKQWIYSIVSYPIFYSNMTLLKIVTITPTIYKKKLIKTLENNLVNESDLSDELLFYKAKKRVINELYINYKLPSYFYYFYSLLIISYIHYLQFLKHLLFLKLIFDYDEI